MNNEINKLKTEIFSLYRDEIIAEATATTNEILFQRISDYFSGQNENYGSKLFSLVTESVSYGELKDGDIVRCAFYFTDKPKQSKSRPSLIIDFGEIKIALPIYTIYDQHDPRYNPNWKKNPYNIEIIKYKEAGLHPSYCKTTHFILAKNGDFIYKYGRIHPTDYKAILEAFKKSRIQLRYDQYIFIDWLHGMDVKSTYIDGKPMPNKDRKAKRLNDILSSMEGNCVDFATAFHEISTNAGNPNWIIQTTFKLHGKNKTSGHVYCIFKKHGRYHCPRYIPEIGLATIKIYPSLRSAIESEEQWLDKHHSKILGGKCYCKSIVLGEDELKLWDKCVKEKMTQKELLETAIPFYFYHLVPKSADISKGLLSPYAAQKSGNTELLGNMLNKYRARMVSGWKYYPDKKPEDLTIDELLAGLNRFRGKDGDKCIYFFKYPPYKDLGNYMQGYIDTHDIYRININDPGLKKHIIRIDWGWVNSDNDAEPRNADFYRYITRDEYFADYTDKPKDGRPPFAPISHIGIAFKDGVCPTRFIKKIPTDDLEKDIFESYAYEANSSVGNMLISSDDYLNNFDEWVMGKNRILYVIGFSGSGKTTLSDKLANEYDCTVVHIDEVHKYMGEKYGREKWKAKSPDERHQLLWDEVIKRSGTGTAIIDGGKLILTMNHDLRKESFIITGTSIIKSTYRLTRRTFSDNEKQGVDAFLNIYKGKPKLYVLLKMLHAIYKNTRSNIQLAEDLQRLQESTDPKDIYLSSVLEDVIKRF